MDRKLWCAGIWLTFWACGGGDATPNGASTRERGDALAGDTSFAGGGTDATAGAAAGMGGNISAGGAAASGADSAGADSAGAESAAAGQPAAGAAGAGAADTCDPSACQNGGDCSPGGGTTCDCPEAFTGAGCELPRFEVLELPAGATGGIAIAVSADGSAVVGNAVTGTAQAGFRWTHDAHLRLLDALPAQSGSSVTAVSADGQVVVGQSGAQSEAVCWLSGKTTPLSLLSAGWTSLLPTNVSADGSVIAGVGTLTGGKLAPFRWTKASGAVALGTLDASTISLAGMSADGSIIEGNADDPALSGFVWKSADPLKLTGLAPLAGDDKTTVLALSADGSTAVGDSIHGVSSRRVRWSNGSPVLLDPLDPGTAWGCGGGPFTACTSLSRDGAVIYTQRAGIAQRWTPAKGLEALPVLATKFNCRGYAPEAAQLDWIPGNCIGPPAAVVWDDQGKVSRLGDVLSNFGITATALTSATITVVRAVSADGTTIIGDNFNTNVVWVARVLPAP